MDNIRGDVLILNGKPVAVSTYRPATSVAIYYEVLRVEQGKLLFPDNHLERLKQSCEKDGENMPDIQLLRTDMSLLLEKNGFPNGNIKLLTYNTEHGNQRTCYFLQHSYPSKEDYIRGVLTKTFAYVRPDPTIKRWNENFRQEVNNFIQSENIYEAVLVNEEGILTEGSRSNIFFIDQNDRIITAPENIILPGITRKYVFEICKKNNITVVETGINLNDLSKIKACFISGTSPKILPVKQLNESIFEVDGKILKLLISQYNELINAQLEK